MDPSHSKPLIRWFGTIYPDHPLSQSPSTSTPTTPIDSSPPSPILHSLNEALNEPFIKPPPRAKLPEHFQASRPLSRPPNLMLAGSTRSSTVSRQVDAPFPLNPDNSPPIRSSLDSLRRVSKDYNVQQIRKSSTSAATAVSSDDLHETPALNSSGWWFFNNDNKDNVDTLLGEDDRADTLLEEQEKFRKNCKTNEVSSVNTLT
jgi:triacylglycerol lipase